MIKKKFNHHKAIYVVSIIGILFTATGLRAEERLSASETLTERTKEFLSDRGRTGSLLGSIIAGAAVANPLAPLLGSVAGFMIGKSSAFSNNDSNAARRQAYNNRSLIPEDGVQVTSLTGLTGKPPQASEQTVIAGLSVRTAMGNQSEQTEQRVIAGFSGETGTGNQSEQTEQLVIVGGLSGTTESENQSDQTEQRVIAGFSGKTGTGNQSEPNEQLVIVGGLSGETGMGNQSEQTERTVALGSAGKAEARSNLPQQLADACSNVQFAQPLSVSCYYYSQ